VSIGPPSQGPDPAATAGAPAALASDRDRDLAVEQLSGACSDGRLGLEDYSNRLERALAARTISELAALTSDLGRPVATAPPRGQPGRSWFVAIMASTSRRGRWILRPSTHALAVMGECMLDLRQAEVESFHSHIMAVAVMGSVRILVPEGIDVDIDGVAIMGNKDLRGGQSQLVPGSPTLRVTCVAIMGEVRVQVVGPAVGGASQPGPARLGSGDKWDRKRDRKHDRRRHDHHSRHDSSDDGWNS